MRRVMIAALTSVVLAAGCTEKVSTYCDGTHPCDTAELPRCDFATRTCMPADDAGIAGDASTPDDSGSREDSANDAGGNDAAVDGRNDTDGGSDVLSDALPDAGTPDAGCGSSAECSAPNSPICGGGTCRGCQNGTECAARSTTTPACHADGRCVECRAHTDCAAKLATPACDLATSTCVACTVDDQCTFFCDRGTGRCATNSDILFVGRNGPSCTSGTGSGTLADPYCQIQTAVTNIGTAKYVYIRAGTYDAVSVATGEFRLRAEAGAEVTAAGGYAVLVNGASVEVEGLNARLRGYLVRNLGNLILRRLRVSGSQGDGIACTLNGHIVVDQVEVVSNAGTGVTLDGCTYTVTNTLVAENGAGSYVGGVVLAPLAGSSFMNNTVVSNSSGTGYAGGVHCFGAAQVLNSVIWYNDPSQVNSTCSVSHSNVQGGATGTGNIDLAPSFVAAGSDNYRYNAGSAGIDVATAVGAPDHDFDGYARPYNGTPDMGAFEWHP